MEAEYDNKNKYFTRMTLTKSHEKQIIETLNIFIIFEYFFGIFRFERVNEELREPNWKKKVLSFCITSTCAISFVAYSVITLNIVMRATMREAIYINLTCITTMLLQFCSSALSSTFFFNFTNIRIITTLANLDVMLQIEDYKNFYKKCLFTTYKYVTVVFITQVTLSIIDGFTMYLGWAVPAAFLDFSQRLTILTFCKYVDLLRRRLKIINNYLKAFTDECEKETITVFTLRSRTNKTTQAINFIGHASDNNTKIRDLSRMYGMIGQACSMVNKIFNFLILTILFNSFIFIITIMWISLVMYRNSSDNLGLYINVVLSFFCWISYLLFITITCQRLVSLRNKTKILLNKIVMNYDLPTTMRDQAKAFMQLVEAFPLRIHVYDMFSIDISLMLKFISVATTYLIVVIQIFNFF
ncbi:hypothetical protein B5X24_HaOG200766 [Helicoverpa armigera]|uniref:Gustatory receptor n=1 Tax=Helicoverpa armigera TaxID=29058 RepID=A0A2W1BSN4_HELAM|nr:hypothetical protein B5X24_HaOG200766 [Helicoverpa armigera]